MVTVLQMPERVLKRSEASFKAALKQGSKASVPREGGARAVRHVREAARLALEGFDLFKANDYGGALPKLQEARATFERYGLEALASLCLFGEGASYTNLGLWDQAIEKLVRTLKHPSVFGTEDKAIMHGYLSQGYLQTRRVNEAVEALGTARLLFGKVKGMQATAFVLALQEVELLGVLHKLSKALEVYEELKAPPPDVTKKEKEAFYHEWAKTLVVAGFMAVQEIDTSQMESLARTLILVREQAQKKQLEKQVDNALEMLKSGAMQDQAAKDAIEEFLELVHLLAIKDPFERWEAIGVGVRERWPKGLSAVDAIREMRD